MPATTRDDASRAFTLDTRRLNSSEMPSATTARSPRFSSTAAAVSSSIRAVRTLLCAYRHVPDVARMESCGTRSPYRWWTAKWSGIACRAF